MSAASDIRSYAERIVRLEQQRREWAADIKDIKAEAKSSGLSPKLIASCVRLLLLEADKQAAAIGEHTELDMYLRACGLLPDDEDDEIAPRHEELAGHHALEERPASNPEDGHVDRSAGARPGNEALEGLATPVHQPGQDADLCRLKTFDRASGPGAGSDVEAVAQVSPEGASDLVQRTLPGPRVALSGTRLAGTGRESPPTLSDGRAA